MTLKEQINIDFLAAYKAQDMLKKNFLGVVKGAIQTEEGKGIVATDENVLKILKSVEKNIKENMSSRIKMNLQITDQEFELLYITPYLPKMMSEDEITLKVKALLASTENKNPGALTGMFNKENKGSAFDNNIVQRIIKVELALS